MKIFAQSRLVLAMRTVCVALLFWAINGCASLPIDQVNLMPAPDVFDEEIASLFDYSETIENVPYDGMLYITDRQPAEEGDRDKFYGNTVNYGFP